MQPPPLQILIRSTTSPGISTAVRHLSLSSRCSNSDLLQRDGAELARSALVSSRSRGISPSTLHLQSLGPSSYRKGAIGLALYGTGVPAGRRCLSSSRFNPPGSASSSSSSSSVSSSNNDFNRGNPNVETPAGTSTGPQQLVKTPLPNLTGSAKLFRDAELEELAGFASSDSDISTTKAHLHPHRAHKRSSANLQKLHTEHLQFRYPNWTGEESTEDAVLRMLVDKYKPLRTGRLQTADEKLRNNLPKTIPPQPPPMSVQETLERRMSSADIKLDEDVSSGRYGCDVDANPSSTISTSPRASSLQPSAPTTPTKTGSWATEPLLPSNAEHKPWHTTFKVPSTATIIPSIKHAAAADASASPLSHSPLSQYARKSGPAGEEGIDPKMKKAKREEAKRTKIAGRLGQAKEAMLDYRLGIRSPGAGRGTSDSSTTTSGGSGGGGATRANPQSMKGWTSLVEDRIEKARKAGVFSAIKGRGQPLTRSTEEHNPFIAREEFLMNRIVQRNGAVPPWVELQTELESAVNVFRAVVMESWVRTASRAISASLPHAASTKSTPQTVQLLPSVEWIQKYRDKEWEKREAAYHAAAVKELNSLVRKYNGMAPYPVRRPVYTVDAEREKAYRDGAELVLENLKQRGKVGVLGVGTTVSSEHEGGGGGSADVRVGVGTVKGSDGWKIGEMIKSIVDRMFGRKPGGE